MEYICLDFRRMGVRGRGMTREEILEGLYEIKNWKCNGDAKTHEVVAEAIKALEQEPKSEWEQDHEILKAYSDGANEVLDKIRAEIAQKLDTHGTISLYNKAINDVLAIFDKYKGESEG